MPDGQYAHFADWTSDIEPLLTDGVLPSLVGKDSTGKWTTDPNSWDRLQRGFLRPMQARVELTLYTDGKVINLNRIRLPQNTPIMDYRKLERNKDSGSKSDRKPPLGKLPFAVSLPNGVSVQLIGLCSSPGKGRQWWRPDGIPFEIKPCEGWSSAYAAKWAKDRNPEKKRFEIALRIIQKGAERVTTRWKFTKGDQAWLDVGHRPERGVRSVFVEDYTNASAVDFKVAIAAGSWDTDCTYPKTHYHADFSTKESAGYAVIWQRPAIPEEPYPGKTKLNVIHDFTDEYEARIMLSDVNGLIHNPIQTNSSRVKNLTVFRSYFDQPTDLIDEFRFQIRPLYWIQFRNISLRPGVRTEPQIAPYVQTDITEN